MDTRKWPALGCGAGLRNKHYSFILSEWPKIDWFEAVTENFMDTGGKPLKVLTDIRRHYPVALHGVSLSIGTTDPLDKTYLKKLKELIRQIDPFVVSDHLCWTGVGGENLHDLLPLPFTEETLSHVVDRVGQVQDLLGRKILLENASTYVTYRHSVVPEWEFIREVARRSGCGLLLDLNNIYVNSINHRFDPEDYLQAIPGEWIGQFHLAGHTDKGSYLFDTHSAAVVENVWNLYRRALDLYGKVSTLIEWDEAIPDFPRLAQEVQKARSYYEAAAIGVRSQTARMTEAAVEFPIPVNKWPSLREVQMQFKQRIQSHNQAPFTDKILNPQADAEGEERMAVYAEGYVARVVEALAEVYEAVRHFIGKEAFIDLCEAYIDENPSHSYNLNFIGTRLPDFIAKTPLYAKLPFLSDLARLEQGVARAFHAFQQEPFDPSQIGDWTDEDWENARVRFQACVFSISSPWPILDIWHARHEPLSALRVDIEDRPQCVLVVRRDLEVTCQLIGEAQHELIRLLQAGGGLGEGCARLAEKAHEEVIPIGEWFSSWTSQGLIIGVERG